LERRVAIISIIAMKSGCLSTLSLTVLMVNTLRINFKTQATFIG